MKQVGWGVVLLLIGGAVGYFLRDPETVRIEVPGPVQLVPKIEYRDTGSTKFVDIPPGPIDSGAVVEAYYTHRPITFTDTAQDVALRFEGVLFRNELITPSLTLHNFRQPVEIKKNAFWLDSELGLNSFRVGGSLDFGKNRAGVNYDIMQGTINLRYSRRLITF